MARPSLQLSWSDPLRRPGAGRSSSRGADTPGLSRPSPTDGTLRIRPCSPRLSCRRPSRISGPTLRLRLTIDHLCKMPSRQDRNVGSYGTVHPPVSFGSTVRSRPAGRLQCLWAVAQRSGSVRRCSRTTRPASRQDRARASPEPGSRGHRPWGCQSTAASVVPASGSWISGRRAAGYVPLPRCSPRAAPAPTGCDWGCFEHDLAMELDHLLAQSPPHSDSVTGQDAAAPRLGRRAPIWILHPEPSMAGHASQPWIQRSRPPTRALLVD